MPLAEKQYDKILSLLHSNEQRLSAVKQSVSVHELGNELWHQLFGRVNEKLVTYGLVSTPPNSKGEGRYLKSIKLR